MREEDHDNPLDLNNLPEDFSTWREAGKQIVDETFTSGCSSTNISSSTNTSSRKKEKGSSSSRSSEGELADENDKVYECRFCSLKFCKSQALGGHMNRHRQERETETLNKARQLVYGNDNLAAFAPPLAAPPLPHSHTHLGAHHVPLGGGSVINPHHHPPPPPPPQQQHHHQVQGMGVASPPHIYQTTRMFHPPPPPPSAASPSNFLTPRPTSVPPPQQSYLYGTTQPHHPLITSSYAPPHSYSPPLPHHHHHHHPDSYFVGHMTTHHIPSTTAHPPGSSNNSSNNLSNHSSDNREPDNLHHHHHHQSAAASSYTCFGAPVGLGLPLPPPAGSTLIPNRGVYDVADATLLGQEEGSSGWTQRQHLDSSSPVNIKSRFQDGI